MGEAELCAENEALRRRLFAAEKVCVLFGWTGVRGNTDRDKALHQLWSMWADLPGTDASPEGNPELTDALISDLARKRDATRARTLARLCGITEVEARERVEREGKDG